jgi:broad specificity phosphatase PhoE
MRRIIHCIRHGVAEHNILYPLIGKKAYYGEENTDTKLVQTGIDQAITLGKNWGEKKKIDLVVVSPLSRTLQTASYIFQGIHVPILTHELLREYPMGMETPNKRSNKDLLENIYPNINFSLLLSNKDNLWREDKEETPEELRIRVKKIKEWLKRRPEKNIALISHATFIYQFLYDIFNDDEMHEVQHCLPYTTLKDYKLY